MQTTDNGGIYYLLKWKIMIQIREIFLILFSISLSLFSSCTSREASRSNTPHPISASNRIYVPDEETAIKIAEAIWLPIYGEEVLESKPFVAKLVGDTVWLVKGTLPEPYEVGGVPHIKIRKVDARVTDVYHTK